MGSIVFKGCFEHYKEQAKFNSFPKKTCTHLSPKNFKHFVLFTRMFPQQKVQWKKFGWVTNSKTFQVLIQPDFLNSFVSHASNFQPSTLHSRLSKFSLFSERLSIESCKKFGHTELHKKSNRSIFIDFSMHFCSDFRYESNGIFVLGVGFFFFRQISTF